MVYSKEQIEGLISKAEEQLVKKHIPTSSNYALTALAMIKYNELSESGESDKQ